MPSTMLLPLVTHWTTPPIRIVMPSVAMTELIFARVTSSPLITPIATPTAQATATASRTEPVLETTDAAKTDARPIVAPGVKSHTSATIGTSTARPTIARTTCRPGVICRLAAVGKVSVVAGRTLKKTTSPTVRATSA